jgi:hypothetical protein
MYNQIKMKANLLSLSLIIFLFSCEKEKDETGTLPFYAQSGSIYISNEGNFQSGNATIINYNPADEKLTNDVFKTANSFPLGDICQSMNLINGNIYAVVNNSGKIEVCNQNSMHKITTISGLISPRFILQVSNTKAYVTDGYSNLISIVNLNDNTISGTIPLIGFAEQMLSMNNMAYVTNSSSDYLYIINPANDVVSDSILLSKGANSIREDKNGKLWVLCAGDYLQAYNGALYCIDPLTKQIEVNIPFQPGEYPGKLCINGTKDTLYFLNKHVWKLSVTNNTLPSTPFISSSGNNFYGLAIDKSRNEIYVSDAIDYIQNGRIFRYHANGTQINNFLAGIIPGDFLFLP